MRYTYIESHPFQNIHVVTTNNNKPKMYVCMLKVTTTSSPLSFIIICIHIEGPHFGIYSSIQQLIHFVHVFIYLITLFFMSHLFLFSSPCMHIHCFKWY